MALLLQAWNIWNLVAVLLIIELKYFVDASSVATINTIYSSCTTTTNTILPNLSFGKRSLVASTNSTCNMITELKPDSTTVDWYYYPIYPPPGGPASCNHTISSSKITFTTSSSSNPNGNWVETATGTVTSGPFTNLAATRVLTLTASVFNGCSSQAGLEIIAGTVSLEIVGGVSCTGVSVVEYCPGLH